MYDIIGSKKLSDWVKAQSTTGVWIGYNEPTRLLEKKIVSSFAKKNFFIGMNFGTIVFATCYDKCL